MEVLSRTAACASAARPASALPSPFSYLQTSGIRLRRPFYPLHMGSKKQADLVAALGARCIGRPPQEVQAEARKPQRCPSLVPDLDGEQDRMYRE